MIPIIDLTPLSSTITDTSLRKQRARDLHKALRINGCVGLVGHGVSGELLQQALALS